MDVVEFYSSSSREFVCLFADTGMDLCIPTLNI